MTALYVHAGILWVAFLGIMAAPAQSTLLLRCKQLAALTFTVLVIESCSVTGAS